MNQFTTSIHYFNETTVTTTNITQHRILREIGVPAESQRLHKTSLFNVLYIHS